MAKTAFKIVTPTVSTNLTTEEAWQQLVYNRELRMKLGRSLINRITLAHSREGANVPMRSKLRLIEDSQLFIFEQEPVWRLRGWSAPKEEVKKEKNYKL